MQRASGSLFGAAFGDALGADTEFLSVTEIKRKYPPAGPRDLVGNPIRVTDDTQILLAVGRALYKANGDFTPHTLTPLLREEFIAWYLSPDNNRAPGNTCCTACDKLHRGLEWRDATVMASKGCGANMRVAPVGLINVDPVTRAGIAQLQAAMTHGHATALTASDLTAYAVQYLATGGDPVGMVQKLRAYVYSQWDTYHEGWLGDLGSRTHFRSPKDALDTHSGKDFIIYGWDECLGVLERLEKALEHPDRDTDPCQQTGAGWIAEEALATGLLCFLLYPESPIDAIARAATTSGDSDSIACLTGAFAGAHLGLGTWSQDWVPRIEYYNSLEMLGRAWD
jgi:ADP-ribosylglycohydrolase